MTLDEIQKRVDALCQGLLRKGLPQPRSEVAFRSHEAPHLYITWEGCALSDFKFFSGDTLSDAFDSADAFVATMPDKAQRHRDEFVKLVAKAADYGNEHGVEADLISPLVATMKQISENALTYQGAA